MGQIEASKVLYVHLSDDGGIFAVWGSSGERQWITQERDQGSTPLMFAAQHGYTEIVRRLLNAGADVGARGDHGLTALGFAQQNRHGETAALLREHGGEA